MGPAVRVDEHSAVEGHLDTTVVADDELVAVIGGTADPERRQQRSESLGQLELVAANLEPQRERTQRSRAPRQARQA